MLWTKKMWYMYYNEQVSISCVFFLNILALWFDENSTDLYPAGKFLRQDSWQILIIEKHGPGWGMKCKTCWTFT